MNNESNINRAELHIHTKTSKENSTIELSEAIKRAKELGLSAIAISNFKNVNDFSKIVKMSRENKQSMKIICGVELPFTATSQMIKTKGYSLTILAKNQDGLNALQELTTTLTPDEKHPACELLDLDILNKNRQNLIIGSTCNRGEVFFETKWWWEFPKNYRRMAEFYDFFEIFPTKNDEDKNIVQRIMELSQAFKVPVVATSNAKHLTVETAALADFSFCADRYNHIYSTDELLEEFGYLGKDVARDVVIKNPKIIADLIEAY